jgi:hypothetical protein
MNLQEQIRRIIREEDFIPLESLNIVIKDYEDGFDVLIMNKDKQIGEISFTKESLPNVYTIVDATIDDEYKGNRIYPKTIINLFKERPNIIINSVFRSPEAEKSWRHLLSNLPSNIGKSVKHYKEEDTTLYQLKLKNIQEHIRRTLKEYLEEARLSDLLRVTGNKNDLHDYIEKEKSKEFEVDRELPTQLTLKKRYNNKKIKVYFNWYDTSKHDLKKRIKERTSFKTITEFTEAFKDAFNYILPEELGDGISENGRYAIILSEYNITIIFQINLNYFDDQRIDINIITLLPKSQIDEKNIVQLFVY